MGVTETLCFRFILGVKAGKEIHNSSRLEFLKKFLENNFAVSDAEDNTSRVLNRARMADLTLLRTLLLRKKIFICICKFGNFKNPFLAITSLYQLSFKFRRFILLVQMKTVISKNHGSSTSSWKPQVRWVRLDHILKMRSLYINSSLNPLTKFTSSIRSTKPKVYSSGTSLKQLWRPSQSAQK